MNCKPGDIARVVRNIQGNLQKLLRVVEPCGAWAGWWRCEALESLTNISPGKGPGGNVPAGSIVDAYDGDLRPLHDGDGVDETLTWAGHPAWRQDGVRLLPWERTT